jgi:hypothetical protein
MPYSIEKTSFILSIEPALSKQMSELLDVLIDSEEEFNYFMREYWDGSDKAFFSISSYREDKIKNRNMTSFEFLVFYTVDKQGALQELLQSPISNMQVKVLERELHRGSITLATLFDRHKENPELYLMRLVNA